MWKAGQLITVKGNIYRVEKVKNLLNVVVCDKVCDIHKEFASTNRMPSQLCRKLCYMVGSKLGDGLYLKLVKPKRIQVK